MLGVPRADPRFELNHILGFINRWMISEDPSEWFIVLSPGKSMEGHFLVLAQANYAMVYGTTPWRKCHHLDKPLGSGTATDLRKDRLMCV